MLEEMEATSVVQQVYVGRSGLVAGIPWAGHPSRRVG